MCDCKKHLHADARCTCHCVHDDSLPEWLFYRFHNPGRDDEISLKPTKGDGGAAWAALASEDRLYWQHEARAVRRAVERNGFKNYDGQSQHLNDVELAPDAVEQARCMVISNGQQCRYYEHGPESKHTFGGGLGDPVSNKHCGETEQHASHAWPPDTSKEQYNCSGAALGTPLDKVTGA